MRQCTQPRCWRWRLSASLWEHVSLLQSAQQRCGAWTWIPKQYSCRAQRWSCKARSVSSGVHVTILVLRKSLSCIKQSCNCAALSSHKCLYHALLVHVHGNISANISDQKVHLAGVQFLHGWSCFNVLPAIAFHSCIVQADCFTVARRPCQTACSTPRYPTAATTPYCCKINCNAAMAIEHSCTLNLHPASVLCTCASSSTRETLNLRQ